jgi:RNA polymerase sigma-70 factor, ECF subfamily
MSESTTEPQPSPRRSSTSTDSGTLQGEGDLLRRLRAGEREAFLHLVESLHGPLIRLAMTFVPSRAVAEEVVQETWVGVLNGLARFEGRSSVKTWIFRILTNRAKTRGEREQRIWPLSAVETTDGDTSPVVDSGRFNDNGLWRLAPRRWEDDTPERLVANARAMERLKTALDELPLAQRAVVTLRDIEGLDATDVCNILEITETNQRVLLHRARSRLRSTLEDFVDGS